MSLFRRVGMYLSFALIYKAHAARYLLAAIRGEKAEGVRAIIIDENRVLLVRHWYAPWAWTLLGGGIARNEEPEEAAIREAREETGLVLRTIAGKIGIYKGVVGKNDKVHVFYTRDFEGSLAMKPNLEIMARSWFDIDNLPLELSPANRRRIEAYRSGQRNESGKW
ncbi:MAG: MutT/nudix family protein [Candidatus Kaiserbacteria bacterium]|nr:MutT/nudix family protein [Candidatus Kaiserbacteria bacterium]